MFFYFTAKQSNNKHAFDKSENETKTRLVFAPDAHYMLTAQLIFRPIQNEFDARPWQPLGSGIPGEDGAKYRFNFMNTRSFLEHGDHEQIAMLDYKGYDSSVDAWIIERQYESIKMYFEYRGGLLSKIENSLCFSKFSQSCFSHENDYDRERYSNLIDSLCKEFIYSKYVIAGGQNKLKHKY